MVASWIVAAFVVLALFIVVFKFQDVIFVASLVKKYMFVIFFVGLFLFFAISLVGIHKNYDIDFGSAEGFKNAGGVYLSWLKNLFGNFGKITGLVVDQDWVVQNSTNAGE